MEKIIEDIAMLIYDYAKSGKEIDKKFIQKSIETMVINKELDELIKKIEITEKQTYKKGQYAFYSANDKTIGIDMQQIKDNSSKYTNFLYESDETIFGYLDVFQKIEHEVEHANQEKTLLENPNCLESKIILKADLSREIFKLPHPEKIENIDEISTIIMYSQNIYDTYYTIAPHERLAQIRSYGLCYNISNVFSKYTDKLKDLEEFLMYSSYLIGYDEKYEYEPTKYYISKANPWCDFSHIEEKAKYIDNPTRMLYGLSVDSEFLLDVEGRQKELSYSLF